jgi:hypothetical protein
MGFTQTGFVPNFTYMLDNQAKHIVAVIDEAKERGLASVEATAEAEAGWVATVNAPDNMTEYLSNCTPGYYNGEGTSEGSEGFLQGHYGEGGVQFYALLRDWLAQGELDGLILKKAE